MNPAFKEYNGLLNIRKIAAVNTLAPFTPETRDLAFKLRRKKFIIEKLHLPPELQEASEQQREINDIVPSLSCGSASRNKLNF
jgi:elongator complex protein 4